LWGLGGNKANRVPDSVEIDSILGLCAHRDSGLISPVSLSKNSRLVLNCDHVQLDLGAIVKGYTADKLSELLLSHGFRNYLIAVGGEIRFNGVKPSGSWRVGVRHPRDPDALAAVLSSETPASISSSGDYERFFIQDGVRYHHIFNPHTGYPARRYCEVTVIAPRGVLSDALSTALFVLDRASGESLLKKYGAQALWIKELPGKGLCMHYSPGIGDWLKALNLDLCPEKAGKLSMTS
jgi:thiamine biosynthesis lipoprotein